MTRKKVGKCIRRKKVRVRTASGKTIMAWRCAKRAGTTRTRKTKKR